MKLNVLASESRMMPALHLDGVRRFVGRKAVVVDGVTEWHPTEEPAEVPALGEYVLAVQCGDLKPADKQTADYCGVKFEE